LRSVEGEVSLRVLDDGKFEVEGGKVFDIRDFGLTPPRILMLKVYPDLKVRGRIVAEKTELKRRTQGEFDVSGYPR
jgi:hypothetical protein